MKHSRESANTDGRASGKDTLDSRDKENAMDYATLGNTGLLVSKLCFGTMTFGDGRGLFKAISSVDQAGADELVRTASASSGTWLDSTRYRPITRSPTAISNGKSFLCWNRKGSACSYGVRLPAACSPASTAGRARSPRIRDAPTTTFRSWTKRPGRSSTCWLRSRKHIVVVLRDSRSLGYWQSQW
jgi:hypothetical protein